MPTTHVYPALDEWVTDPIKKLDYLLSDATIANSDQSDIHETVSVAAIYADSNSKKDFVDKLSTQLQALLLNHYHAAEVLSLPSDSDDDTELKITVNQDDHSYTGNYILNNKDSLFTIINKESA